MLRFLSRAAVVLAVLAVALVAFTYHRAHRTFDAPLPDLRASSDPAVIERGRYLAYGAAHCVDCHGNPAQAGQQHVDLTGGNEWHLPFGTLRTPNITPDARTGIGAMTDAQLARSLRHGVGRDGQMLLPFMPFANMSDEDLTAVISFLRAQKPVRNEVVTREINPLGWAVLAYVLEPQGPTQPIAARVEEGPTAEYGEYLANSVGNCGGCHTKRDLATGQLVGAPFAGGTEFDSHEIPGAKFVSPNLTPAKSGRITGWTEETFVARLKAGAGAPGTPMPWRSFSRMQDDDLRAIFRYLQTLPAVETGSASPAVAAK